jgi:1,4-dihydroxy-2-naphthoyl-CoA hydrolase
MSKGTSTTDSSTKFIAAARVGTTLLAESVALRRGRTPWYGRPPSPMPRGKLCVLVKETQLILESKAQRSADDNC